MTEKFTLKQWRNIRGLTQEELAEQAGITARTIGNYEKDVKIRMTERTAIYFEIFSREL